MEVYIYNIKDLPIDERPREKLMKYGASFLSTAELIAVLFRSGTRDKSAIDLAHELIATCGDSIKDSSVKELMRINGIGQAKASSIVAAIELSTRLQDDTVSDKLSSPDSVYHFLKNKVKNLAVEHFISVMLNTKNEVICVKTISVGTVNRVIVHPREVYNEAIRNMATSIIVAHNHPSGDSTPSKEDIEITKRLIYVGKIVGINLLDHIVIGNNNYTSLKEEGYFDN